MAARVTMAALITAVRVLINDPANPDDSAALFKDQQIQDALDHTREDVNYLDLAPKQSIQAGGTVVWLDYYAMIGSVGLGDWEADAVLQGYPNFAVLTPATSDYLVGHWTFTVTQRPPVFIVGKNYDRFAAAAEILEDWASQLKLGFSFSSDSQKFNVKEQSDNILQLADRYKQRARPRMLQMVRSDTPTQLWQRGTFDNSRTSF